MRGSRVAAVSAHGSCGCDFVVSVDDAHEWKCGRDFVDGRRMIAGVLEGIDASVESLRVSVEELPPSV